MSGSGNTLSADEVRRSIDAQVVQEASDAGVDVEGVIESTIAERGDYGRRTVERFAVSALNRQIEAAASDTVSGILCGSRDRHGKNWPRRHALVKSDGDHLEASTWDGTLPTPDGTEVEIPAGAAVEIGLEHDSQYDSYEAKQLHSVQDLDRETLASRLASIAKSPGDLSRDDEYEIVAVRGEIRFVNPQTVFEDGEPQGDGEVMMTDERGQPKPHFELVLAEEANTRVRGHVERQRYSEPYFDVEDFDMLIRDAFSDFDSPDQQSGLLNDALRDREVVVVGNVNSFDQNRSQGTTTRYVDMAVAGVVELPDTNTTTSAPQQSGTESETDDATDDAPETGSFGDVKDSIEQYADLVGLGIDEITVETVDENMDLDAPDSVVQEAIIDLGSGDDPETGSAPDTSDADSPIEACRDPETGQLLCPADGCIYSASGEAGLFGHIVGQHAPGAENPEEWVANQVGE
jgi:hypothetical protein